MENQNSEAWVAANAIVNDLLNDISCCVEKCATIYEIFGLQINTEKGTSSLVDAFRGSDGDMMLTGLSHRHSSFQVIQLSVAKQHDSGCCGHYALHNALLARKMCRASSTDETQDLLKVMNSVPAFWWRYWLSVRQLLNCVTDDSWWPWTEDHIVTGDMERSFLHYLLEQHPTTQLDPPILVMQVRLATTVCVFIICIYSTLPGIGNHYHFL